MAIISASGNIGRDGELKFIPSGTAVLTFSVATKHGFGDKAVTSWLECEVWGKFAEAIVDRVTKGSKVSFSGNFWIDQWETQDGKKGMKAKVRIIEIDIQGPRQDDQRDPGPPLTDFGGDDNQVPF